MLTPPGQLARIVNAAFTCGRIVRARVYGDRTWSVVSSYARLKVLALTRPGYTPTPRTTRVAGWKVTFWAYPALAYIYASKFIDREYWFRSDKPRPYILDCGANTGLSILYFKTLFPDAEIIGFEPNSETFEALQTNVRDNRLAGVQLHRAAVGAAEGTAQFYAEATDQGSGLASLRSDIVSTPSEVVPVVRLSPFVDRVVDLLKIDIEGGEMDVMRELAQAGKLALVREIVIEYHHHMRRDEDVMSQMLRLLEDAGFGYYLTTLEGRPVEPGRFQGILIHAYAKHPPA